MKNLTLTLTLMGLTALTMGCKKDCDTADTSCDTGSEADADADSDSDADADSTYSVTWGADSIDAAVTNADMENGYYLGLAETGAGTSGWYGEDCQGDESICHEFYDTWSVACASSPADVEQNVASLHCAVEDGTTWAIWGFGDGDYEDLVASGGDDPSHFGG